MLRPTDDLSVLQVQKKSTTLAIKSFLLIGAYLFSMVGTCWVEASELKIEDLNIFQSQAQPDVNPVTISFRVHNAGSAFSETFTTTIYVDFADSPQSQNIVTKPIDGKPSIDADERIYFSWTTMLQARAPLLFM